MIPYTALNNNGFTVVRSLAYGTRFIHDNTCVEVFLDDEGIARILGHNTNFDRYRSLGALLVGIKEIDYDYDFF